MVEKPSPAIFFDLFYQILLLYEHDYPDLCRAKTMYNPQLLVIMSNQTFAYFTLAVLLATVLRFIFNFVLRIIEIL